MLSQSHCSYDFDISTDQEGPSLLKSSSSVVQLILVCDILVKWLSVVLIERFDFNTNLIYLLIPQTSPCLSVGMYVEGRSQKSLNLSASHVYYERPTEVQCQIWCNMYM